MIRLAMMRGDTRPLTVTLSDTDGAPLDLDLLSDITFTAKESFDVDTNAITKTLADGITITDASEGICTILIEPADTSELAWTTRFVWDIEVVTDYEDAIKTVARGYLFVYRDVTVTAS